MSKQSVDPSEFAARVRTVMNRDVGDQGHHPGTDYTPAAVRHYVRERALLKTFSRLPFETALDVGCAEGFFVASIHASLGKEVWGVDLSDLAVRRAAARHGGHFAAADALKLPLPTDSFDLVYSTETIEHVLDPEQMLAEMRRVARRWVVVTTPISESAHQHEPDYELRHEGHINDFDPAAVRRLFGTDAQLGSFRCNASFALLMAVGRYLPSPLRDGFYGLDYWVGRLLGTPDHRIRALRNRDWLIVSAAQPQGPPTAPDWVCPRCHGALEQADSAMRCPSEGVTYAVTDGVPDFAEVHG
jgi:SAM-dependent methyltransferase